MKKRIFTFLLLLSFVFAFCFNQSNNKRVIAETLNVNSKSVYLIDSNTNSVIYSKNETERLPIASMCKIMTLLITFENINNGNLSVDEQIIISKNASSMGGSQVFLEENNTYLVNDLIKSVVVASANDASVALAERICGSEENFVEEMNAKCNELNMDNTHFVNCTGLPKDGQYSCAKDVATMFTKLIKFKDYFNYSTIWMDKIFHDTNRYTEISNTNKLVRFYSGCNGGKTGYTKEAGHCLSACASKNNTNLVCVVIKAPDSKTRFGDVSHLFDYGFNNYTTKKVVDKDKVFEIETDIKGSRLQKLKANLQDDFYFFIKKGEKVAFEFDYNINKNLSAPLKVGDKIGVLDIYNNGKQVASINVLSAEKVNRRTYSESLQDCIKNWFVI